MPKILDGKWVRDTILAELKPRIPTAAIATVVARALLSNTAHFTERTLCVGQAFQPAAAFQAALCRGLSAHVSSIEFRPIGVRGTILAGLRPRISTAAIATVAAGALLDRSRIQFRPTSVI